MKANVPEKIYFSQTEDGRQYFTPAIPFEREFVEYTRTDVFIEKAYEWLEPVLKDYVGYFVGEDILGDFRNYMKGE